MSDEDNFKIGDTVRRKAGRGPTMTVVDVRKKTLDS